MGANKKVLHRENPAIHLAAFRRPSRRSSTYLEIDERQAEYQRKKVEKKRKVA
jgi:hypothetical protein